jgi:hypothetical protein
MKRRKRWRCFNGCPRSIFNQRCSALSQYRKAEEKIQRLSIEYYNAPPRRRPSPCEEKGASPDQNDAPKPKGPLQLTNAPILAQPGPPR